MASSSMAESDPNKQTIDAGAYERPLAAAWTQWIDRTPAWGLAALALLLLIIPLLLGLADGLIGPALASGEMRFWFLWPTLIIYTTAMMPLFVRADQRVISNLRPLVQLDDAEFAHTLQGAARFSWRTEAIAFLVGVLFGALIGTPGELLADPPLLTWYLYISGWISFGLLGWIVVVGMTSSRLTAALYRQPISVDLFDIEPFEPVGRQSLLIALTMVGGTLISLLFIFDPTMLGSWQNLVIYSTLTVVTVLLFFANMWPTHSLLARTKRTHLKRTERRIAAAYSRLDEYAPANAQSESEIVALSAELQALIAAERRLKFTRTWPYDTETVQTLAISVLTPLAVGASRLLAAWLASRPS